MARKKAGQAQRRQPLSVNTIGNLATRALIRIMSFMHLSAGSTIRRGPLLGGSEQKDFKCSPLSMFNAAFGGLFVQAVCSAFQDVFIRVILFYLFMSAFALMCWWCKGWHGSSSGLMQQRCFKSSVSVSG